MGKSLNLILSGFGGQGVLFAGKLIAYAGLVEGREVSWLPSYGPEMRGGTANCSVCLSDDAIGSPLVTVPDVLVAMNQPSFDKFKGSVQPGGLILIDSTMVQRSSELDGISLSSIPASQMAEEAGLKGFANVIIVGKLFAETAFCSKEALFASVDKCVPARKKDLITCNREALNLGMQV